MTKELTKKQEVQVINFIEEMLSHRAYSFVPRSKINPKMLGFTNRYQDQLNFPETGQRFLRAKELIAKAVGDKKKILFIETRKHIKGSSQSVEDMITKYVEPLGFYYVTSRWLPGTITNWKVVKEGLKRLNDLDHLVEKGELTIKNESTIFSKKEGSKLLRERRRLSRLFRGLKRMSELPDLVIFTNLSGNRPALQECIKKNIETMAILDLNEDPDGVDFPIALSTKYPAALDFAIRNLVSEVTPGENLSIPHIEL
jgi:small subunit ribosomal protein S2